MASIRSYQSAAGLRYLVAYRTLDRKQSTKRGFERYEDAVKWRDENVKELREGTFVKPSDGRKPVGDLADTWLARRAASARIKPSTKAREAGLVATYIRPRWGAVPVSAVTADDVQAWVDAIVTQHGKSPSTARQAHWVLNNILAHAVEDHLIRTNPARKKKRGDVRGVELPREERRPRVYLTAAQLLRLADAAGAAHDIILTLGLTGLRVGELSGLRVADVDVRRRRIKVERSVTDIAGRLVEGKTKTGEVRAVAYPHALDDIVRTGMRGKRSSELLFTMPGGGPVRDGNLRARYLRPAQAVAGTAVESLQVALGEPVTGRMDPETVDAVKAVQERLGEAQTGVVGPAVWKALGVVDEPLSTWTLRPDEEDFGELAVHDLRHTAASLAFSAGANPKVVQTMLGHKSAAMTLDVYADLFDSDLDDVADALDGLVSAVK